MLRNMAISHCCVLLLLGTIVHFAREKRQSPILAGMHSRDCQQRTCRLRDLPVTRSIPLVVIWPSQLSSQSTGAGVEYRSAPNTLRFLTKSRIIGTLCTALRKYCLPSSRSRSSTVVVRESLLSWSLGDHIGKRCAIRHPWFWILSKISLRVRQMSGYQAAEPYSISGRIYTLYSRTAVDGCGPKPRPHTDARTWSQCLHLFLTSSI